MKRRLIPILLGATLLCGTGQAQVPKDQLIKVLYWIATHPSEGDLSALGELPAVCLDVQPPDDAEMIHERIGIYAMKLLGRLTGKIK